MGIKFSDFFFAVIKRDNSEILVKFNRTLEHLLKCFQGIKFSVAFNVFGLVNSLFGFMFCFFFL